MVKHVKQSFESELKNRSGKLISLPGSRSLFDTLDGRVRIYVRYSKLHSNNRTFYGLRHRDLDNLSGRTAFICFLWDNQSEPLIIPYEMYDDLFQSLSPATDDQYKVQVLPRSDGIEMYIAGGGRFNVESYMGWEELEQALGSRDVEDRSLTHSQVQTLLGAIGAAKGFQIWIPRGDRCNLDWENVPRFEMAMSLPPYYESIKDIAEHIDVIWFLKGNGKIHALYEVEHSTSIYSGLLRFNDIHLVAPSLDSRFSIVAEHLRRLRFARQLRRPTFTVSGLSEACSFLEYPEVYKWYKRIHD